MDSRLKISGMTKKRRHSWMVLSPFVRHPDDFRAVFSLPLNVFIAPCSSPRQSLSRGPQYLKIWIPDWRFREWRRSTIRGRCPLITPGKTKNKKHKRPVREKKPPSVKAFGFPIKNFGNDEWCGCLIKALRHDGRRGSFLNGSTRNPNNRTGNALCIFSSPSSVIARSDWGGDLTSPHPLQETLHIFPRPRRERVRVAFLLPTPPDMKKIFKSGFGGLTL